MTRQIAEPRLSATILLLRDAPAFQVFMARRHHQIDFASGALVFPGGKTSKDDERPEWAGRVDGDLGSLTVAGIAAVRETYEESGLLLCRPADARGPGAPLTDRAMAERLAPHRAAVDRGEASFLDLLADAGLVVALDRLVRFSHWVTPEFMPKRFDTHFFLAHVPEGQIAEHDGRETTDSEWIAPADALSRAAAGQATILFPTRLNLEMLGEASDAEAALDQARARPVARVMPVIEKGDDGQDWLTIPADAGYATWRVPLAAERAGGGRQRTGVR